MSLNNWQPVIGLEVHVQLATKTKLFSSSPIAFGAEPNTQASEIDLGLPGVLPVLNKEAISHALKFGCATPESEDKSMEIRGRNLAEGVPNTINFSSLEAYEAISGPLSSILQSIRNALEQSPPELSADISERGIVLTGGGALLTDLDIMISEQTGIPVIVADDPLTCVVKGGGIALDIIDKFDVDLLSTE